MNSRIICAFVCCASLLVAAQTRKLSAKDLPATAFKLISIKVSGNKNYSEDQIVRETGLRLGQTASDDDFKTASRLLGETGAFSQVLYTFQYSREGTKLEFQVIENDQLVPARFDNFVWFTDSELMDQLRTRVPLFQGKLPLAGELADRVSDALQALLVERNIPAKADYLRGAKQDGPVEAFIYRATGPVIHIRDVDFSGAGASEMPLLKTAGDRLKGVEYSRSVMMVQAEKNLLPVYLSRGYLRASFGDSTAKVAEQVPDEILVDVTFPVLAGKQYKVTGLQVAGASAFSQDKVRQLIHQQVGEPANAVQLDADMNAIRQLYETRGYMEAAVKATPEIDDSQSAVQYQLQVQEGDVFKMGDLDIRGLDSRTTARLVDSWKLTGNDVYNNAYLKQFVQDALKQVNAMGDWKVAIHESVNEKDKTVDVSLRFDPK
jgi:outer membrane protein assembly factor BamA